MTSVVLTQDRDDIGRAIAKALSHIDIDSLVRGRLVAVKPNETWATKLRRSGDGVHGGRIWEGHYAQRGLTSRHATSDSRSFVLRGT